MIDNPGKLQLQLLDLRKQLSRSETKMAYLCLSPALLSILVWSLFPVLSAIYFSFTRYEPLLGNPQWIGFDNYTRLIEARVFKIAVKNTILYTTLLIPGSMSFGLLLAVLVNEKLPFRGIFRTIYFSPYVVSLVAIAMVFQWIFHPLFGAANAVLEAFGLPAQQWLHDPNLALPTVVLMSIWRDVGYSMIIFLAGLQAIPDTLYEAAKIDGANRLRSFLHVTLPLLRPVTFFLFIMGIIRSMQVFTQILILTSGGPLNATTSIVHQIYLTAFAYNKMGLASAMAILLAGGILILTILNLKFFSTESVY